jgi:pimeloyl-ACP methyl ester carboxylesterase
MGFSEEMQLFGKEYPYQSITLGRASFRYILAGQKGTPAVVFLNGGMNCSEMWYKYVQELSQYCRVLTFDYPRELTGAVETADAVARLMEKLGIDCAVLAGASFGGFMAQLIAKRHPEKVCGLGLFSTSALTETTIKNAKIKYRSYSILLWVMKRKNFNYEKLKPRLIAASMKQAKQESAENRRYLQEMFEYLFKDFPKEKDIHITGMMVGLMKTQPCHKEDFAYLNGNVAMLLPEKDFFSKGEQQELIDTFPGARMEYVQNGHFGTVLECEKYFDAIRSLIKKC